ncbi:MAG: NapC/NirT family cytochrome c [Ignavibacteriales bacterium]|nr:NapC/NirT family cytochrome c [Ignavibacteriales bacterium]
MKRIFPASFYNLITLAGATIASVSFGLIVFLMVLELFAEEQKPYMGIIAFLILPGILLFGIALIIAGILREHRRERKGKPHGLHLPHIDLNNPRHRTAFFYFSVGGILLLTFTAFGSFKAYEYTDSDAFCGEMCHKVMEPEYTAYQFSPHARVGCVKCHIGPGAGWFVRSKLSGAYQVYATVLDKYPRPIPTPIENLRPAQETCEQCHWPKHFFSEKQRRITNYIGDEINTKWTMNLLMKIGGGNIEAGPTSGIHWHMNINNEVTYIALDTARSVIPWVRVRSRDGVEQVYRSTEFDVSEEELQKGQKRRMDCVDCHNRPTHIYHPPARSINHVMELGWIDRTLPFIKSVGVQALEHSYASKQGALDSIRATVEEFYRSNYPDLYGKRKQDIDRVVTELQTIYRRNYFPEMKHDWRQYPDHIGHMYSAGCFRCHDGKHISDDGQLLSRDCNSACHTILSQQFEKEPLRLSLAGIDYRHPVDIGDAWKEMNCSDCHNPR